MMPVLQRLTTLKNSLPSVVQNGSQIWKDYLFMQGFVWHQPFPCQLPTMQHVMHLSIQRVVMCRPGLKPWAKPSQALKSPGQARPKPCSGHGWGPGLRFWKPKPSLQALGFLLNKYWINIVVFLVFWRDFQPLKWTVLQHPFGYIFISLLFQSSSGQDVVDMHTSIYIFIPTAGKWLVSEPPRLRVSSKWC